MKSNIGTIKDFHGIAPINFGLTPLAADPDVGDRFPGMVWFNTTANAGVGEFRGWDGENVHVLGFADIVLTILDAVAAALPDTATLDWDYDAGAGTITGTVLDSPTVGGATAAQLRDRATHTGTQVAATISDFAEEARDRIAAAFAAGAPFAGITFVHDDAANTFTLAVTDSPLLNGQNAAFYLARANHTGQQTAATISDFDARVDDHTLDALAAPVADVSLGGFKATDVADPVAGTDAANRQWVLAVVAGQSWKPPARLGSVTSDVNIAAPGADLDGVALDPDDVILLMAQVDASQNGPWVWHGAAVPLTRPAWFDEDSEVLNAVVTVQENGVIDQLGDKAFILTNDAPVDLGVDDLVWAPLPGSSGAAYTFSGGVQEVAGDVSLKLDGDTLVQGAGGVKINVDKVARKAEGTFGDGVAVSFILPHNFGNIAAGIVVVETASGEEWDFGPDHTDENNITVDTPFVPAAGQFTFSITG